MYFGYGLAFASNFIVKAYGWRWAFWSSSIISLLISIISLLTVREPVRSNGVTIKMKVNMIIMLRPPLPLSQRSYVKILKRVLMSYRQLPLLLLCIGAGIRQGGGLVWAYNAKAYFR